MRRASTALPGPGGRRRPALAALTVLALALVVAAVSLAARPTGPASTGTAADQPASASATATGSVPPPSGPGAQLTRATDMPAVPAGTGAAADLPAEVLAQPDLFARAFVTGLLTQDYRRPRTELLAWVQAHSAQSPEPLVTGLIPADLRDKWAVFSVTDTGAGPAPVPSPAEWDRLAGAQGRTTVEVQRVTEPYAWTAAVASGRITDPGVTGREVTATVTLHAVENGIPRRTTTSVALRFNLEGPPTRSRWGFVTLAAYTAVPVAAP